ncbi:MAG: hypothetical protein JKY32_07580 [Rhizobiales bacterium]|nr:hypothetical protein [Hyphomicrobiales bacterium]
MHAKVKQSFSGQPDSDFTPRTIEVGEIITGDLAEVAVREKWATKCKAPLSEEEKAARADAEAKAKADVEKENTGTADGNADPAGSAE